MCCSRLPTNLRHLPFPGRLTRAACWGADTRVFASTRECSTLAPSVASVSRDGSYYALTNRHVAGGAGEEVQAFFRGEYHRVGVASDIGISRATMSELFPRWPANHTQVTLDAGLVRIDNMPDWTAQAFGIGEIGEIFDATEQTITLDLIGRPVRAFGGTTGVIEGEIQALFFRYKSQGGFDYITEVFIGPRTGTPADHDRAPFTRPGDSGTLWFYDPPSGGPATRASVQQEGRPEQGKRARRLRPIAMQWGGQRREAGRRDRRRFRTRILLIEHLHRARRRYRA